MQSRQKFEIGDVVEPDGTRAPIHSTGIFTGHPRWHALMVSSQREQAAEAWLSLRGVYAFHPVTKRVSVIRGKQVPRESRYLPGYVFARFPGRADRHRVMACPFITDALRVQSGAWGVIVPADIRKLHAMRSVDAAQERARKDAQIIRKGDRVRVLGSGPDDGPEVEVHEIVAGKARFRLHMFGADRIVEANIDRLHKIG